MMCMDQVLRALAEQRRREILRLVATEEVPAGRIAEHFDVTRPAISQHLQILRDAGLVRERREGTRRLYRAEPRGLAPLRAYLERTWAEALDAGRRLAEERQDDDG